MPDAAPEVTLILDSDRVDDVRMLAVAIRIRNAGSGPIRLDTLPMRYAAAVLQVRHETGALIPGMPPSTPPVPGATDTTIVLAPNANETFEYKATSLFHDPIDPGRYAIRFRVHLSDAHGRGAWSGDLESRWVSFTVTP